MKTLIKVVVLFLFTLNIQAQDAKKAKQLLGYHPKYSFQEGLKEAVKWYWENLK